MQIRICCAKTHPRRQGTFGILGQIAREVSGAAYANSKPCKACCSTSSEALAWHTIRVNRLVTTSDHWTPSWRVEIQTKEQNLWLRKFCGYWYMSSGSHWLSEVCSIKFTKKSVYLNILRDCDSHAPWHREQLTQQVIHEPLEWIRARPMLEIDASVNGNLRNGNTLEKKSKKTNIFVQAMSFNVDSECRVHISSEGNLLDN